VALNTNTNFPITVNFDRKVGNQIDTFEHFTFSGNAYASCSMFKYILAAPVTGLAFKSSCLDPCNEIEFDTSIVKTMNYNIIAYAGPNHHVTSSG
jgi:hypothetical protein